MRHFIQTLAITVAVSSLGAQPVVAKEISAEQLRELQGKIKASETLTVDFVQSSYKALRGKTTTRKGKAVFARPDKFKWMLETPVKEYRLYDGVAFYDFRPEEKTVQRYSPTGPQAAELRGIVDLVLNFDTLLKRYELVKADEANDVVTIQLKPKALSEVTGVELRLSTKDAFITYLRMDLKSDNKLTHEFSNPVRTPVPADTFALPAGAKVVDTN